MPEVGRVVALVGQALVGQALVASVRCLVARLALGLAIWRDKMTVQRAQEIEVLVIQMKASDYFPGPFLLASHGSESFLGWDYFALGLNAFTWCSCVSSLGPPIRSMQ